MPGNVPKIFHEAHILFNCITFYRHLIFADLKKLGNVLRNLGGGSLFKIDIGNIFKKTL